MILAWDREPIPGYYDHTLYKSLVAIDNIPHHEIDAPCITYKCVNNIVIYYYCHGAS